jgi:hypothetical protein
MLALPGGDSHLTAHAFNDYHGRFKYYFCKIPAGLNRIDRILISTRRIFFQKVVSKEGWLADKFFLGAYE